ncbi:MAG: hypothetical protein U0931_16455 [Vulcanimicrobiota bacterium]
MAFSMTGMGPQKQTQSLTWPVRQQSVNPLSQAPANLDPQDTVVLGGQNEPAPWKGLPRTGGATATPKCQLPPKNMEQLDSEAASAINALAQTIESWSANSNFGNTARDQQVAHYDMLAAQAIQRQTQLAMKQQTGINNPKTQAAFARLGGRPGATLARQALEQQRAVLNRGGQQS